MSLEKEVNEVDFAGLLVGRSFVFEEAGNAERVLEGVELLGLLEDREPGIEGFTGLVGIRKDDDLVIDERGKEFGLEHLEASAGEPDEVLDNLRENDSGLLGFHDTYHRIIFDHGFNGWHG